MQMSFSPVLEDSQGSGELSWVRVTCHLRKVTQRLREVDGGELVWATWNHGKHGEVVVEEERKLSREKMGREHKIPWLLCQ
jgi:hypothetical protein